MFWFQKILLSLLLGSASSGAAALTPFIVDDQPDAVMRLLSATVIYPDMPQARDGRALVEYADRHAPEPFGGVVNALRHPGPVLLGFSVVNPLMHKVSLVLTNEAPIPIAAVKLITRTDGVVSERGIGGFSNLSRQVVRSSRFAFALELLPGVTEFYLMVDHQGHPCVVLPSLRTEANFASFEWSNKLVLSCVFVALLFFVVYHAFASIFFRARVYWIGSGLALLFAAVNISLTGYSAYLIDILGPWITSFWWVWLAITGGIMAQFYPAFLSITPQKYPFIHRMMRASMVGCLVVGGLCIFWPKLAQFSVLPGVVVETVWITCVSVYTWRKDRQINGLYFALGFLILFGGAVGNALAICGALPSSWLLENLYAIGSLGQCFCGLTAFNVKSIIMQRRYDALKYRLKGAVSDQQIDRIFEHGAPLIEEPSRRYVTVMAIDIVGYSMMVRRLQPSAAFDAMKDLFTGLASVIHEHDGIIDKSQGDGILCFFGYNLMGDEVPDHENRALRCASALQRHVVHLALRGAPNPLAQVFPLRIGLHSAEVFLGNMGDATHWELTLGGDAVELASQLESASEPFKIVLGQPTYAKLDFCDLVREGFNPILIPFRDHEGLIEAYEYDPFAADQQGVNRAKAAYWQVNMLQKKDPRFACEAPLLIDSSHGPMQILNFSIGGFCLSSTRFFARGTNFELDLTTISDDPRYAQVSPLVVEVAWSMSNKDGTYRHGVSMVGANSKKRSMILDLLQLKLYQNLRAS